MEDKKIWRILNTVVLIAWCITFCVTIPYLKESLTGPHSFLSVCEILAVPLTLIGLILCYFVALKFIIYAVLCCLWGLDGMLSGSMLIGFIMYLVSFLFLWRQNCVPAKWCMRLFIISLIFPALIIFLSANSEFIEKSVLQILAFLIICVLVYFLLRPLIDKKTIPVTRTLDVSELGLSEREIRIFRSVLKAEKYGTIAQQENISISYVKKCMKDICQKIHVCDRTELLTTYAGYTVTVQETTSIKNKEFDSEF